MRRCYHSFTISIECFFQNIVFLFCNCFNYLKTFTLIYTLYVYTSTLYMFIHVVQLHMYDESAYYMFMMCLSTFLDTMKKRLFIFCYLNERISVPVWRMRFVLVIRKMPQGNELTLTLTYHPHSNSNGPDPILLGQLPLMPHPLDLLD